MSKQCKLCFQTPAIAGLCDSRARCPLHHRAEDRRLRIRRWERSSPGFAVVLNWGTGLSFLNALVNALDKLHIVRGENSSYCGSKYSRWTVGQQTPGHFQLPFDECRMEDQLGPFAAICVCRQCSTWRCSGRRLGTQFLDGPSPIKSKPLTVPFEFDILPTG